MRVLGFRVWVQGFRIMQGASRDMYIRMNVFVSMLRACIYIYIYIHAQSLLKLKLHPYKAMYCAI